MQMIPRVLIVLLLSLTALAAAEQKAVFDLTSGDAATIEKHLVKNIESLAAYYAQAGTDFKAVVVISGNAYKYFVEDLAHSPFKGKLKVARAQKVLGPLLERLHRRYNVEFDMCKSGREARHIDQKVLYDYVRSEMNKTAYLIKWQNDGYAYIPVH